MAGLSQKVCKGVYDQIPSTFSNELNQVIKSCLQVNPSNRPSVDKILAMPGIKMHMTEKLEEMNNQEQADSIMLSTIRCPRNLGDITNRLPKPQYNSLTRSASQGENDLLKPASSPAHQIQPAVSSTPRVNHSINGRIPVPKRIGMGCPLPTIQEDTDIEDYGSRHRKINGISKPVSSQVKARQNHLGVRHSAG